MSTIRSRPSGVGGGATDMLRTSPGRGLGVTGVDVQRANRQPPPDHVVDGRLERAHPFVVDLRQVEVHAARAVAVDLGARDEGARELLEHERVQHVAHGVQRCNPVAVITVDANLDGAVRLDVAIEHMPPDVTVGLDAGDGGVATRPADVAPIADLPAPSGMEGRASQDDRSGPGRDDLGVVHEQFRLLVTEVDRHRGLASTVSSDYDSGKYSHRTATASCQEMMEDHMPIELPPLPYDTTALEPYLSAETFEYHYGKHHKAYVDNLNKLIEGTDDESKPLEDIIMSAEGGKFNNAAQIWNHTCYWNSMAPGGGGDPTGAAGDAVNEAFGGIDAFREEFKKAAVGQFGSGWAWLVLDGGKLAVMATANADLPMKHGKTALVTCDVWEHAYYIDYRNKRPDYVDTFLQHLINWDAVSAGLSSARRQASLADDYLLVGREALRGSVGHCDDRPLGGTRWSTISDRPATRSSTRPWSASRMPGTTARR